MLGIAIVAELGRMSVSVSIRDMRGRGLLTIIARDTETERGREMLRGEVLMGTKAGILRSAWIGAGTRGAILDTDMLAPLGTAQSQVPATDPNRDTERRGAIRDPGATQGRGMVVTTLRMEVATTTRVVATISTVAATTAEKVGG